MDIWRVVMDMWTVVILCTIAIVVMVDRFFMGRRIKKLEIASKRTDVAVITFRRQIMELNEKREDDHQAYRLLAARVDDLNKRTGWPS